MATVFKRKGKGPWIIQYFDHQGRRREKSSRTTDKRAALRLAAKFGADVALRREGVVDPALDRQVEADAVPVRAHVAEYVRHLRMGDRSPTTVADAERHLAWVIKITSATRISDLTLDAVTRALDGLRVEGRAARTVNHRGGSVRAFLRWCVRTGRASTNPLQHLPKLDEQRDRRRVRRELTDEELERLFAVADERGRGLWYRLAFWAALRRSDLERLTWGDVDLARGVIVIRHGKAHRVDEIPIHPELLPRLRVARGVPAARIFPNTVTNATRRRDFERAGIPLKDEQGRYVDLHALRVALGTRLAREGIPPQIAQRIMRHADYRTTLKHYTALGLSDDAAALAQVRGPSSTPSSQGAPEGETVRDDASRESLSVAP